MIFWFFSNFDPFILTLHFGKLVKQIAASIFFHSACCSIVSWVELYTLYFLSLSFFPNEVYLTHRSGGWKFWEHSSGNCWCLLAVGNCAFLRPMCKFTYLGLNKWCLEESFIQIIAVTVKHCFYRESSALLTVNFLCVGKALNLLIVDTC